MPADRTASNPPSPTDDASRVGWLLTGITCAVLLVGIGVIRYVTGGRPKLEPIATTPPLAERSDSVTKPKPPPIVLRPTEVADERGDTVRVR